MASMHFKTVFLLLVGLLMTGMAGSPPLVGGPAPDFKLKTVDGKTIHLADLKGKFVVLNFWATWCAPCTHEMPELDRSSELFSTRNIEILAINFAERKEKVDEYARDRGLTLPLLLDESGNVAEDYRVLQLPVTYFVSPDGIIWDQHFGGGLTQKIIEAKVRQRKSTLSNAHHPAPTRSEKL